jgi:hypothetical protein
MKKGVVLVALIAFAVAASPALAGGNANGILGIRTLDEDDWEPIETQGVFGVNVDIGGKSWPVHIEFGSHFSGAEEDDGAVELTGGMFELHVGVMKDWALSSGTHPFVGGGLALISAAAELEGPGNVSVDDDDQTGGVYVHGGVFWRLGGHFNLGIDGRITAGGDADLFGGEVSTNYWQLGLILGGGWD